MIGKKCVPIVKLLILHKTVVIYFPRFYFKMFTIISTEMNLLNFQGYYTKSTALQIKIASKDFCYASMMHSK